jgi:hypothetical protein
MSEKSSSKETVLESVVRDMLTSWLGKAVSVSVTGSIQITLYPVGSCGEDEAVAIVPDESSLVIERSVLAEEVYARAEANEREVVVFGADAANERVRKIERSEIVRLSGDATAKILQAIGLLDEGSE